MVGTFLANVLKAMSPEKIALGLDEIGGASALPVAVEISEGR
jgi:hypothetical protein